MTADSEIFQDLCNTLGIRETLQWPVDIPTFLAGAHALRELGRRADTEPKHIQQCIQKVYQGLEPQVVARQALGEILKNAAGFFWARCAYLAVGNTLSRVKRP